MKKIAASVFFLGPLALGMTVAMAASDPIATRQSIMQTVGIATKASTQMVKGQAPFDVVKAELAMRAINTAAISAVNYFPKGSEKGGKTRAAPKIWEDMKGFLAAAKKMEQVSAAGIAAVKGGENPFAEDDFKEVFAKLVKTCSACHEAYRLKKEQ